jgi:cardiolipin synthase
VADLGADQRQVLSVSSPDRVDIGAAIQSAHVAPAAGEDLSRVNPHPMLPAAHSPPTGGRMFFEDDLKELRRRGWTPAAFLAYLRVAGRRIRGDMDANPGAVRSVWLTALGFFAAAFVTAVVMAVAYDRSLAYAFFLPTAWWILATFAIVTLNVGLLRNHDDFMLSGLNVPIVLTLSRVVMVPGIAMAMTQRHLKLALAAYVVAAMTDVVDGWIARRWRQQTRLGTVMDPVVDIVFSFVLFMAMSASELVPLYVMIVAVLRYSILLVGGAYLYLFVGPLRIQPTAFGRMTGVLMSALIGFVILVNAFSGRLSRTLVPLAENALGVLMSATVVYVIVLGWVNLRRMSGAAAETPGRVVGDVRWGPQ